MGRLSDARKKAKAKQGGGEAAPPPAAPAPAPAPPADPVFDAAFEPAPPPAPAKAPGLPSSGLADEILAAAAPAPKKTAPLPSSGLAEDLLGATSAPAPKKAALPSSGLAEDLLGAKAPAPPPGALKKTALPSSGLAEELLGAKAPEAPPAPPPAAPKKTALPSSGLADDILQGKAGDVAGDDWLTALGGTPKLDAFPDFSQAFDPKVDSALEADVLSTLTPEPARPKALPSSGLAEDVLGGAAAPHQRERTPLGLDEVHEFESFFEDERHEIEQLHLVLFEVGHESFAVEIDRVHEVIRVPAITRVPHLAAHVKGVVNLRGRIVPVMDLRLLMGIRAQSLDRASRIMVLDIAQRQIGVFVDRVSEVQHVSVADVEPPPEEMRAVDRNLVTAVARIGKRMIFILDMDKVLALK